MNITASYKFVDVCRDKFDQIFKLVNFSDDVESFKKFFFENLGNVAFIKLLEILPEDLKESATLAIKANDMDKLKLVMKDRVEESKIEKIFVDNFNALTRKVFEPQNYDSIRSQVESILEPNTTSGTTPQTATTA
mgnify:CR=1 FL=1